MKSGRYILAKWLTDKVDSNSDCELLSMDTYFCMLLFGVLNDSSNEITISYRDYSFVINLSDIQSLIDELVLIEIQKTDQEFIQFFKSTSSKYLLDYFTFSKAIALSIIRLERNNAKLYLREVESLNDFSEEQMSIALSKHERLVLKAKLQALEESADFGSNLMTKVEMNSQSRSFEQYDSTSSKSINYGNWFRAAAVIIIICVSGVFINTWLNQKPKEMSSSDSYDRNNIKDTSEQIKDTNSHIPSIKNDVQINKRIIEQRFANNSIEDDDVQFYKSVILKEQSFGFASGNSRTDSVLIYQRYANDLSDNYRLNEDTLFISTNRPMSRFTLLELNATTLKMLNSQEHTLNESSMFYLVNDSLILELNSKNNSLERLEDEVVEEHIFQLYERR
jgi:hypothetical protein